MKSKPAAPAHPGVLDAWLSNPTFVLIAGLVLAAAVVWIIRGFQQEEKASRGRSRSRRKR
jgi:hypothetical protein